MRRMAIRPPRQILLVGKALVEGNENIETCLRQSEQFAICLARKARFRYGHALMLVG